MTGRRSTIQRVNSGLGNRAGQIYFCPRQVRTTMGRHQVDLRRIGYVGKCFWVRHSSNNSIDQVMETAVLFLMQRNSLRSPISTSITGGART
jgi:hypothetical protein